MNPPHHNIGNKNNTKPTARSLFKISSSGTSASPQFALGKKGVNGSVLVLWLTSKRWTIPKITKEGLGDTYKKESYDESIGTFSNK